MTTDALIIKGDCLNVMAGLPDGSIDAIVTDPPYGLGFMGKNWDHSVPGEAFWREALRVAKPGCHILAAGGSRTYHRLAVAIEDAGWEIRDCVMWLYGSGFPKSLDVSKAIDKAAGHEQQIVGMKADVDGRNRWNELSGGKSNGFSGKLNVSRTLTAPATPEAKQWQGWGTALKPAFEPIIVARKPLDGTVAENVLTHGTGGINVDGCRVAHNGEKLSGGGAQNDHNGWGKSLCGKTDSARSEALGRWPANVIHDGSDEVVAGFPETGPSSSHVNLSPSYSQPNIDFKSGSILRKRCGGYDEPRGSAARFFYCAKASRDDRSDGNHHPTVKPIDLMKYLCRLVTPPGGLILDPFCGSGSTGVAAIREGFNFIGIELNADYAEIARRRIDHERNKTPLFSEVI